MTGLTKDKKNLSSKETFTKETESNWILQVLIFLGGMLWAFIIMDLIGGLK